MSTKKHGPDSMIVHIVSHGPYCLDGVTAAVAVARYREGAKIIPRFSGNEHINEVLRSISPEIAPPGSELWITDISWTEKETDRHLQNLAELGVKIYWFDHHRTALKRYAAGEMDVPFTDQVVSERAAAAQLVYEYLQQQLGMRKQRNARFAEFGPIVAMADDNDRWIHAIPGSRELALTVRVLGADRESLAGYQALLNIDADVTYTPVMRAAHEKARREIDASFRLAENSCVSASISNTPYTLVAAICDGHPSEIGDAWGKTATQTVFAFYDLKGEGVSFRRSLDCDVDLSRVAQRLGGGGHPAAAGCRPAGLHRLFAEQLARVVTDIGLTLTASEISE
jgi:uncharacterized protein